MGRWLSGPALLLLVVLCSCNLNEPVNPTQAPAEVAKDLDYSCPDEDGDGFSRISLCGLQDCNDQYKFSSPDLGSCPDYPYLEYDPPDNWQAADFSLIQVGQLYHLFYIKGQYWQERPDTDGKSFGYATTEDGLVWTNHVDALAVNPDSDWDDAHIWSPCIVRHPYNNQYYMFYTGITYGPDGHEERIGLATSPNFNHWNRVPLNKCEGKESPGCLWAPDFAWNAWSTPGAWTKQCRDPFVFWDEPAGCWYMVYTTVPAQYEGQMVLGLAKSDNLYDWTDCGPLMCSLGSVAESAALVRVDGLIHMFWTSRADGGISHATTTDPESGNWSSPSLLADSVSSYEVASELLDQGGWFIFGYVPDYPRTIRLKFMKISGPAAPLQEPLANLTCEYIPPENIYPGAPELANGIDDNCNGLVDEGNGPCVDLDGDAYGNPASIYCPRLGLDCDDNDPAIHPGATGSCTNGIDDNCNGLIDEPSECLPKFPVLTTRY